MSSPLDLESMLAELVSIPSVSHLGNGPLITHIQHLLEPLGWHQRVLSYHDAGGVEKQNLIVSPAPFETDPVEFELAIVCHTDTVPYCATWAEATQLREQNGMLHGCGACDVKGFLACVLATLYDLTTSQLRRPFCAVFTADEELGCRGAQFLAASKALRARFAIVGEPTSLIPSFAGKGYCLASVTVRGKAAHSAYPAAGVSAIFAAARMLVAIEALSSELMQDRDEAFSPPFTTLNVGEIRGGTAKNVVPELCSFLLEWRPIPAQPPQLVADRVLAIARDLERELTPAVQIQLEVLRQDAGFSTSPDSAIVQALTSETDAPVQTIAFGTEAPWLARMGAEAVVIGPGSMLTAHSERECVPIDELHRCKVLLRNAVLRICG